MHRRALAPALALLALLVAACNGGGSTPVSDAGAGLAHDGDPCRTALTTPDAHYQPAPLPGDIVWVDTPEIVHDRDYYPYESYVQPGAPTNWTRPTNFTEGQIWLHVEVLDTPAGAVFPIYYTVTWQPGRAGVIDGFLRAAVAIDHAGPGTYDAVADVRSIEYSPDGSCCQSVCDHPWPWDAAWQSVAGDVVVLQGQGFPLRVKTRIVLRPPEGG